MLALDHIPCHTWEPIPLLLFVMLFSETLPIDIPLGALLVIRHDGGCCDGGDEGEPSFSVGSSY